MKRFSGSVSVISYGKPNPLISKRQGGLLPGRDGHCWPPPGQIRTCPIKASGSYRRYLTTSNLSRRLVVRGPAPVTRFPGSAPGTCFAGPRSPRSPPFAPPAPPPVARPCSLASSLLWRSPTSRIRASSASTPRLPDTDPRYSSAGQTRDLPVPAQRASTHARVLDHAGSGGGSRYRTRPCCLPGFRTRRHPGCSSFRGSMAGLCAPLPTLRRHPRECQRTAQGRCGSLLLHRGGLSPPTPCRSSRRTENLNFCNTEVVREIVGVTAPGSFRTLSGRSITG